jgi:hypothetical protein
MAQIQILTAKGASGQKPGWSEAEPRNRLKNWKSPESATEMALPSVPPESEI